MDDLRLQAVAARVVAWHNRHPLARRITAAQVKSVGYVGFGTRAAEAVVAPHRVDGSVSDAMAEAAAALDDAPKIAPKTALNAAQSVAQAAAAPAAATVAVDAALQHEPGDADFEQAFAELAELAADEKQAAAQPPVAEEAPQGGEAEAPALPSADSPPAAIDPQADADAEFAEPGPDAGADDDPLPLAVEAAKTVEVAVEVAAEPAAEPAALTGDVALLESPVQTLTQAAAPGAALAAAPQVQPSADLGVAPLTLRDRLLMRSRKSESRPAGGVQGAMVANHGGYTPQATPARMQAGPIPAVGSVPHGANFMAPLSPQALARWVARHGRSLVQPPTDGPVRHVSAPGGPIYVMTAAIEGGALRSRVLVGAGKSAAVLGPRLYSLPRMAFAAALVFGGVLAAAVATTALLRKPAPAAEVVPVAAVVAAASAAAVASAAASASAVASASAAGSAASAASPASPASAASAAAAVGSASSAAPAVAPVSAAMTAPEAPPAQPPARPQAAPVEPALRVSTERPLPGYAQRGDVGLPNRGSVLSEEKKTAARQAVADAREALARGAVAPQPAAALEPSSASQAEAVPPAAAPVFAVPKGPVFAVSTRVLRTRAEAEQLQAAMDALLRAKGASGISLEILPEGEDFRVVAWPFSSQASADSARALLASRAMRVKVVEF